MNELWFVKYIQIKLIYMNKVIINIVDDLVKNKIIDRPGGLPHFGGKQYRLSTNYKKNGINLHDEDFIQIGKMLFDMTDKDIDEAINGIKEEPEPSKDSTTINPLSVQIASRMVDGDIVGVRKWTYHLRRKNKQNDGNK
jgi:hypothetical protein